MHALSDLLRKDKNAINEAFCTGDNFIVYTFYSFFQV